MTEFTSQFDLLPLDRVTVTDEYCRNAFEREVKYLLSLDTGRLLAGFYENAGIRTPYVRYGGWESGLIGGHTLGHYLTAISQAQANGGVSPTDGDALRSRIRAVVDALLKCQAKNGFLWGAPLVAEGAPEAQFDNVERGKTNIKREAWVPWYTMHKILSGLLDAYRLTGYAPALAVAKRLGDWVCARTEKWDKRTQKRVLAVEYGGMNDCLYALYAATDEKKYAEAAHRFDEEPLFDLILTEGKDVLKGKHANTTIPKILGALNRYRVLHGKGGDESRYLRVAERFFKIVTERHAYVTGGISEWEHFGADYVLDQRRTNCTCETCIAHNMLKLAAGLFSVTGDPRYTDHADNTFTNSILASQNPETGMATYFQPMASGFFKVFSQPYSSFWCCTGSGMENFTKLSEGAYYTDRKGLYIERYLSSRVKTDAFELEITCNFPLSDTAIIRIVSAERAFPLFLRVPDWAASDPVIKKNGESAHTFEVRGHLHVVANAGDKLELKIPVEFTLKGLPDGKNAFAVRYGGAVLSADLGTEDMRETTTGVDVSIPAKRILSSEYVYFDDLIGFFENPSAYFTREGEKFTLHAAEKQEFGLHYKRYRERYAVYLRMAERGDENRAEETPEREPLDVIEVGYGQYEADELHALEEKNSRASTADGTCRYARGGGYFSYDLRVDPAARNVLSFELMARDNGKPLRVTAEGVELFSGYLLNTMGEERYRMEIPLPQEVPVRRKKVATGEVAVVRIKFEGLRGRNSARVCGFLRMDVN